MIEYAPTPGPWRVNENYTYILGANPPRSGTHAPVVCAMPEFRGLRDKANARLIAAAPELLEALQAILDITNLKGSGHPLEAKALAAIQKATAGIAPTVP